MKRLTLSEEVIVKNAMERYIDEAERRLPKLVARRGTCETEAEVEMLEEVIAKCEKRIEYGKNILKKVMV